MAKTKTKKTTKEAETPTASETEQAEVEQIKAKQEPLPVIELDGVTVVRDMEEIDVEKIGHGPFQVREVSANAIGDLLASIKQDGLLQPITVRQVANTKSPGTPYEIVAGHRRFEAVKGLGWKAIPAQVVQVDDEAAYRLALIENMKRVDLNPMEEAVSFKLAISKLGWTEGRIAEAINRPVAYVKGRLDLTTLPSKLQEQVSAGLSPAKAWVLAPLDQFKHIKGGGPDPLRDFNYTEAQHEATLKDLDDTIARYFDENTLEIGDEWDTEICKANGCLGKYHGAAVCLKLTHAFEVRATKYADDFKALLADFFQKAAPKLGMTPEAPVFYDLERLSPGRTYRPDTVKQPDDWPACPKPVCSQRYKDDKARAMTWSALRQLVTGKAAAEACLACPAWTGKKEGRAVLLALVRDHQSGWNDQVRAEALCMSYSCRQKQIKASQDDPDKDARARAKEAKIKAEQPPLIEHATSLVDRLLQERPRVLAAHLLSRYKMKDLPGVRHDIQEIASDIGLRTPEHDNTPNGALKALMSLGEDTLFRLIAEDVVRNFDGACGSVWQGYDEPSEMRWSANALRATTSFLYGDDLANKLSESLKALKGESKK